MYSLCYETHACTFYYFASSTYRARVEGVDLCQKWQKPVPQLTKHVFCNRLTTHTVDKSKRSPFVSSGFHGNSWKSGQREKHHFNPAENHYYSFNNRKTIQWDYLCYSSMLRSRFLFSESSWHGAQSGFMKPLCLLHLYFETLWSNTVAIKLQCAIAALCAFLRMWG